MKKAFLAAALLAALAASARAITPDKPEFKKLADGVYAYVGKLNDANAMVVVTSQGVVVIDTGNNQPETRNILKHIQAVTQQPVRYIVITQNHGDHIGGTPLFSPPATVVLHERTAKEWAGWKPYQVNTWRKRFPERAEAMKNFHPLDAALTFTDRMTLRLGGKTMELIYIDDPYNPGDIAVWMPEEGVLHAGFAGYKERHPDIRPDYSHGTTVGMMKQLEALIALKPKVVVPAHGPLMGVADLQAMIDYLVIARQKVRAMMDKGMPLEAIRKNFRMEEYKGWDREQHYPVIAATIHRELRGEGPEITPVMEKTIKGKIEKIEEEGRFLTVSSDDGKPLALRISNATDIEGVADRSYFKVGMRFTALYEEQKERNETLQFQVQ
ncbi:MAG TPA: MBL fold metallo-hydrolase [Candidatus Binatia bacterium]|jgi:glyoxylase-like metal-dependent hydrolase (beta-lactamase superfamily II)